MTLNNSTLKKLEKPLPFNLTPEQKNILMLWFGADSKFGWSKLDFLLGIHRVRHLYPNHRDYLSKDLDGLPFDPTTDLVFDHDGHGNPVIRLYDSDVDMPF